MVEEKIRGRQIISCVLVGFCWGIFDSRALFVTFHTPGRRRDDLAAQVQGVLLARPRRGCTHTCSADRAHTLHSKDNLDIGVGAGRSLPRRRLSHPVSPGGTPGPHAGTAPSRRAPAGRAGLPGLCPPASSSVLSSLPLPSLFLCLFLHYFSAPPTLSLPLLPSPGFCSFSPLPLPPPRSLPPSPIPAPAAQPVSIKYRSPVLYQWSAELTSPARCFSQ